MRPSHTRPEGLSARATGAFLFGIWLLAASVSGSSTSECLQKGAGRLAAAAACGDAGSIKYCLSELTELPEGTTPTTCYQNAGCTAQEAAIEADWAVRDCVAASTPATEPNDLRRRQKNSDDDDNNNNDDDKKTTSEKPTSTKKEPKPTAKSSSEQKATKESTTKKESSTTKKESSTATKTTASTSDSTTATSTTDSTTSSSSSSTSTGTSLQCYITSDVSTSHCPTQSTGKAAGKTLSCFPTSYPTASCAPGLMCGGSPDNNPTCFRRQDHLTPGGIVVAIAFSAAIAVSIVTVCFFCLRERREHRRLRIAAEAAALAKGSAANKKRPSVGARSASGATSTSADEQPLMGAQYVPPAQGGGYYQPPPLPGVAGVATEPVPPVPQIDVAYYQGGYEGGGVAQQQQQQPQIYSQQPDPFSDRHQMR